MESVINFMDIFQRSTQTTEAHSIVTVLKNGSNYMKNVPKNGKEKALSIIFEVDKGILAFIKSKIPLHKVSPFNGAVKEAFTLLQWIMEFFREFYEPYIYETRDLCYLCVTSIGWFHLRKTAADTYKKLIELFNQYELNLNNIITHYNESYLKKYDAKDGCVFYILIGATAKYCHTLPMIRKFADGIFMQILRDLENQFQTIESNSKPSEDLKIYLECLSDMFENFTPFIGTVNEGKFFEKLYLYILEYFKSSNTTKMFRNLVLYIFSSEMEYFSSCIIRDYHVWRTLFDNIIENNDDEIACNSVRTFYQTIALHIMEKADKDIFVIFEDFFIKNFENNNLSKKRKRLIIYGLGEFAPAFSKFSPNKMFDIFQRITIRAWPSNKQEDTDEDLETITDYLEALTKIFVFMPHPAKHQMNFVIELSVHLIKHFPFYTASFQDYTVQVIKNIFVNISKLHVTWQAQYYTSIFHGGILLSCSHAVSIDAELQQELEPDKKICTYKDYLPLWTSLFEDDDEMFIVIFEYFVQTLMDFTNRLNLNLKTEINLCFSNPLLSKKAVNEDDYRFFINLIDLYVEVFDRTSVMLYRIWSERLFIFVIEHSRKHPLISGFYKFFEMMLKKPEVLDNFFGFFTVPTRGIILNYIRDVSKCIPSYFGELQIACIEMTFNVPVEIVSRLMKEFTVIFRIAFQIGLSNLPLAIEALETLEYWKKLPIIKFPDIFFLQLIFCLEPYLNSEQSLFGENLDSFQKKILMFYGSLKSKILTDYVHQKNIITNATWNRKNLVQCELLFSDCRLNINYDKLMLKVKDLVTSGDHTTRLVACECLHSLITIIIGKKLMDERFDRNLCNSILNLSCDPNDVIRNMYHPLGLQITHLLSSESMKRSKAMQIFLDCLFEGLSEEFNSSLKDYCGVYLKEFVQWSIKQSTERDLEKISNVRNILLRIINLASYPSIRNNRGAVIAFNYIHWYLLDEHSDIVNIYWFQIFYLFVKNLDHCYGIEITNAIDSISINIGSKSDMFSVVNSRRLTPACFKEPTLKGLMLWLFNECYSPKDRCRAERMRIFNTLFLLLPDPLNMQDALLRVVHDIALNNLKNKFDIPNGSMFLRTLQFYNWILRVRILHHEDFFTFWLRHKKAVTFSRCFEKYIINITSGDDLSTDEEFLCVLSNIILKIIEFGAIVTHLTDSNPMYPVYCEDFFALLSCVTLTPHTVGLTAKRVKDNIHNELNTVLKRILEHEKGPNCISVILINAKENLTQFTDFAGLIDPDKDTFILVDFILGLQILQKCNFINFRDEIVIDESWVSERLKELFAALKNEALYVRAFKKIDDNLRNYLTYILEFLLYDCSDSVLRILISQLMCTKLLERPEGQTVEHGDYFLEVFRTQIMECLVKNSVGALAYIDDYLDSCPDKSLIIIEEILRFSLKTPESEVIFDEIIKRFDRLHRLIDNKPSREEWFMNIYSVVVTLKDKPYEAIKDTSLYRWIIERLTETNHLNRKNAILRNFLVCLVGENQEVNRQTSVILRNLRHSNTASLIEALNSDDKLKYQTTMSLQILFKGLIATKNLTIFEALMKFSVGILKYIFMGDTRDYLTPYFASVSDEIGFKSINLAYKVFKDLPSNNDRLDILRDFLIPSIECASLGIINIFYHYQHKSMLLALSQKFAGESSNEISKLSALKIGMFNMFETIFSRFDLPVLNIDKQSIHLIIVRHALEVRQTNAHRLLQCAALTCCIALMSLKKDEKYYKFIFAEDHSKNQILWERIVPDADYVFHESSSSIHKERKKYLNIRCSIKRRTNQSNYNSKLTPQTSSLSLLEDVHAYDLNDRSVLVQPKTDQLLGLSFENDLLNEHECMPMLVGLLVRMYEDFSMKVKNAEGLPDFIILFKNGFCTRNNNARLFLLRILGNAKQAFLPFLEYYFGILISTIADFLTTKNMNYIIRDTLTILIESGIRPRDCQQKQTAKLLIQMLIARASERQEVVTNHNIELLESLWALWCDTVSWPRNETVKSGRAAKISLVVLKSSAAKDFAITDEAWKLRNNIIENLEQIFTEKNESDLIAEFEVLGWLCKLNPVNPDEERRIIAKLDEILSRMSTNSAERCVKCVCALHRGWQSEEACGTLFRFANKCRQLSDSTKILCIELFGQRLEHLNTKALTNELFLLDFKSLLVDRVLCCEGPILDLLPRLVPLLPAKKLKPYIEIVSSPYYSDVHCCILENRRKAYRFLISVNCSKPLIRALSVESSEELRDELLNYWNTQLPGTCLDRLFEVLGLYETGVNFTRFLCLTMLELTKSCSESKQPMFRPLNDQAVFHEYDLVVPWQRQNIVSVMPLFLTSLAWESQTLQHNKIIPSCNSLFGPGAYWQPLMPDKIAETMSEPSMGKLSKRNFNEELSQESYHDKLWSECRNKFKLSRSYRIGELPDVEISQESFVNVLQQMVMKDQQCCRQLAVEMLKSLIKRGYCDEDETRKSRLLSAVTKLTFTTSEDVKTILLEAMLSCRELLMSIDVVTAARNCHAQGENWLGILLLEQRLIAKEDSEMGPKPSKQIRLHYNDNCEREIWAELANFYRAIESHDMVSGVFSRPNIFSDKLREAALAQAAGDWANAVEVYEMAERHGPPAETQYCLEGAIECLENLGSWCHIASKLADIDVLNHERRDFLLPKIIESHLYMAIDDFTGNRNLSNYAFLNDLDEWLGNLKDDFPQERCMVYVGSNASQIVVRHALNLAIDQLKTRWITFDDKNTVKLRLLYNIYAYDQIIKNMDFDIAPKALMKEWGANAPQMGQDILTWNKIVSYRLVITQMLHVKAQSVENNVPLLNDLIRTGICQRIRMSDVAIYARNAVVAKRHIFVLQSLFENFYKSNSFKILQKNYMLTVAKYRYLCAKTSPDIQQKYKYYLGSWQIADKLRKIDHTRNDSRYHLYEMMNSLRADINKYPAMLEMILSSAFIKVELNVQRREDVCRSLKNYVHEMIKSTRITGDSYANYSQYCYNLINDERFAVEGFIESTLTAMRLGSMRAVDYFPCLLKHQFYCNNDRARQLFKTGIKLVPCWLFLSWQAQIMACLGKPLGMLVAPIIVSLAKVYPNAIMYSFKQSYERCPDGQLKSQLKSIYDRLFANPRMKLFFEAMHKLCQPELYLSRRLLKIFEESQDHVTAIGRIFKSSARGGPIYKVLDKFKPRLEHLKTVDFATAKKLAQGISRELGISMKSRIDNAKTNMAKLRDYCSYLAASPLEGLEIEIPGQYVDGKRPFPKNHVMISRFDNYVRVMDSQSNPIKIVLIGSNAKSYGYLVKCGEDLTQDQRLQQIFKMTNKKFCSDPNCYQRYMLLNTYFVLPLSSEVGLIEWVDDTRSLREYIDFSISSRTTIDKIGGMYQNWISSAKKTDNQPNNALSGYATALHAYDATEVITKMKELISYIEWDCLRQTFMSISTSFKCFITLRQTFITSYATMCVVHWLTSVGDRHLENTLIQVRTGKCYGIDFGAAFGAGIDQIVPELVPFRLTPQILGLFQPFDENALFGITMTHALTALREHKSSILALLDMFINEPIDWSKYARDKIRQIREEDSEPMEEEENLENEDVRWLPRERISIIERKLNGVKPSNIMIDELAIQHGKSGIANDNFLKYKSIVSGDGHPESLIRTNMRDNSLTPKEQVECLLNQATDLNLLGRMWVGWCPFV